MDWSTILTDLKLLEMPEGCRLCTLSEWKLDALWEKVKDLDKLYSDDIRYDFNWFRERMLNAKTLGIETEGGMMILTNINENLYAEAHVIFWDRKLSPHLETIKKCIVWSFLEFNLQRLETITPEYTRTLNRFIESKLGFKHEGRMRKRMLYKGQFCDVHIHSLLREEVI